jgi:hypothetical protein
LATSPEAGSARISALTRRIGRAATRPGWGRCRRTGGWWRPRAYYRLEFIQGIAAVPLLGGLPRPDTEQHGLPKGDLYWDIFPRGMEDSLVFAGSYGVPLIITENGIADAADINRPRFLAEHVAAVAAAIQKGVPVIGYFHWSLIDNFEWAGGFCPKLGLYSVDFTDPARPRTARPSADVYRAIVDAGEVTDQLLAAQPAYTSPAAYCVLSPSMQ